MYFGVGVELRFKLVGLVCNKMIILIGLFLVIGYGHIIISVTPSTSTVSANDQLAIKLLTSSAITTNSLAISITPDFALSSPCLVNGTVTPCSFSTSTTALIATLSAAFLTNTYYIVTLNVTNPIYASNFPLSAAVSGTAFANTGLVTITALTISCSMAPSSQLVGDSPQGYFQIGNSALPANSIISINSTLQTTFPNLFNSNPACTIGNASYACSLSTSFGQQFLTINSPPLTSNLALTVNSINNPPYNSSFANIGIQIQNTAGFFMQVCSFQQQAVTTLRTSTSLALSNWNSQVGATSTVAITLSTYFKPYTTSLLWVFPSGLSLTALTPASSTLTIQNNTITTFITSASAVGNSLTFSVQITNPTSVQSLSSMIYVVFSSTQFIEQLAVTTMKLSPLVFTPAISLSQSRTQYNSNYNVSIAIPNIISGGYSGSVQISYGVIICSSLGLVSSSTLQVSTCFSNNFAFTSSSTLPQGTFWVMFSVSNYYSTITNSVTISLTSAAPNFYSIGSGTSSLALTVNAHSFTITNNNPVFNSQTTITVQESTASVNIPATQARIISIYLPKDIVFSSGTSITALSNTNITQTTVSSTSSSITINAIGPINLVVNSISNPVKYNGSLIWSIIATDLLGNPSSSSVSTQQPMYTATTLFLNNSFNDSTIQASNAAVITIIPALQYYSPPTITVAFSNSLLLSCSNCTIISSTSFTITYYAAIMRISLVLKNSNHPNSNSISAVITAGIITYQTGSISYSLLPMTYGYTVYQTGLFGTVGNVNITITSMPTQSLTLTYSDVSPIMNNSNCISCTNSLIYLSGIIRYFQTFQVSLVGTYNNTVYAKATVLVKYICQAIQGCNICVNQTTNSTTVLVCQQCFSISLTPYSLLYNNQCLQNCPISTYSNGYTCINCQTLCYICTIYQCEQCVLGYYLYNNTCISSCPAPLVNNATHCINVPIVCPSNCASCPSNNYCTACEGGFYLLDSVCYSTCPSGYRPSGSICVLFVPPQQTSYFPFPFLISSGIIFIVLWAMKCFEKRSLIMGNLIAFVSLVEVGSMIMTLTYTLQSSQELLTQALCFILLFSKITLNLIFLCYFLKAIGSQQQFQAWKEADEAHLTIYKVLITFSTIFSFQIIRIIYSRLMGLKLFFGKFNTSLIFKPLNYFTITYFLTAGAALVALSVRSINLQNGYRTSAYYSSIQSIIMEALMLIICFVDNKKGYDDEFFEYQVYKVNNEYESSHINPVDIQHQDENGGSMHQMLNATSSMPTKSRNKGSQIVRNPRWVKKAARPLEYPQEAADEEKIEEQGEENIDVAKQELKVQSEVKSGLMSQEINLLSSSNGNKGGVIENKRESLFRRKIIEDWRRIEGSLPNRLNELRNTNTNNPPKKKAYKKKQSVSPQTRRKASRSKELKRVSSMNQIQLQLPETSEPLAHRIKQYFHQQNPIKFKQTNHLNLKEQNKLNKGKEDPKSMTLSAEQQSSEEKQESLEGLLNDNSSRPHTNGHNRNVDAEYDMDFAQRRFNHQNQQNIQEFLPDSHQQDFQQEKQSNIEDQFSNDRAFNHQPNPNKVEGLQELQQNQIQLEQSSQKKINLGNYRYNGEEEKEKRYRTKKRRVNKQTEEVYLQRLVASSERKSRNLKIRKLQF